MRDKRPSRIELRRMVEAAAAQGDGSAAGKTAVIAKPKKRRKAKTPVVVRMRAVWCVFNSNMKEVGRYPYANRAAADARATELTTKHKTHHFVQPSKEPMPEPLPEVVL